MKSLEIAPGLLVVYYDDGTVEIASNYPLPDAGRATRGPSKTDQVCSNCGKRTPYGGPGNVFMPLEIFKQLQAAK